MKKRVRFGGKEWDSIAQLARVFNKNPASVRAEIRKGRSLSEILHGKRGNKFVVAEKEYNTTGLAKAINLSPGTIRWRKSVGWGKDVVLPRQICKGFTAWGRTQSLTAWCREKQRALGTVRKRLKSMSLEQALTYPVDERQSRSRKNGDSHGD